MSTTGQRQIWDRRADETDKAWETFEVYRDLGRQRSIPRACEMLDKAAGGTINDWASRYEWTARVRAYDQHHDELKRETEAQEIARDIVESFDRKRKNRRRNAILSDELHAKLREAIKVVDADDSKGIRELCLAAERLGMVEDRSFRGLPNEDAIGQPPPDATLARELERYTVEVYLKRTVPVSVESENPSLEEDES
jgi:hypothetical protein